MPELSDKEQPGSSTFLNTRIGEMAGTVHSTADEILGGDSTIEELTGTIEHNPQDFPPKVPVAESPNPKRARYCNWFGHAPKTDPETGRRFCARCGVVIEPQ